LYAHLLVLWVKIENCMLLLWFSMYIIYIFFWPADEVPPDILIEKPRIKQKFPLKNAYLRYNWGLGNKWRIINSHVELKEKKMRQCDHVFFWKNRYKFFFSKRSWWYFVDGVSRAECRMLIYSSLIKANVDGMSRAFL